MNTLSDLYQEVIMDHNHNPRNFREMKSCSHRADGNNPLCGDRLTIFLKMSNNVINDISFTGSGCAISKASASIMTAIVKNKSIDEALSLFEIAHEIIMTGESNSSNAPEKLKVLAGVHKYPIRVKCASLPWHTLKTALHETGEVATTE
jgi:nitrogen fixation NifU-like protein